MKKDKGSNSSDAGSDADSMCSDIISPLKMNNNKFLARRTSFSPTIPRSRRNLPLT